MQCDADTAPMLMPPAKKLPKNNSKKLLQMLREEPDSALLTANGTGRQ
jgi:hypothetical protein